ncbi:MAG TPA: hypothetical protein PLS35_15705 [Nitrospira sp.]|nr:hypothetical protein [Nitrospira sp.]
MMEKTGKYSPSGVWVAEDFRSNLIIDRYDPVFADMRASKLKHLRSLNSEDAITWNVFRSLRQVNPVHWLTKLWENAFPAVALPGSLERTVVRLWESVAPPLGLLEGGDEGDSEIDVMIESSSWVWFIEAKYRSDISTGTKVRPDRDQILRNLDVGTHYAGVREFFFSLLIDSVDRSRVGIQKLEEYQNLDRVRGLLATHRADGLKNLKSLGVLTWRQMGTVLHAASESATREDEQLYASRAHAWMVDRRLVQE